ncbi:MAG: hypothetical protein HQK52_00360 [Oligoflexia bacterium]|nr:hypothetical protein [Oligoflexia bacterium]
MTKKGQALIEYILILAMMSLVAVKATSNIRNSLNKALGNLAGTLSIHLTVGVCGATGEDRCFFKGYANGKET